MSLTQASEAPRPMRGRRAERCAGCGLTPCLCLCATVTPLATRTKVRLLVHHVEAHKRTNTARLAVLALSNAALHVYGRDEPRAPLESPRRMVLFPAPGARPLVPGEGLAHEPIELLVPDGTWSQARRIARRDPWAEGAELVCLPEAPATRYDLRRNTRAGGLCTFEAVARALAIVEDGALEAPLLALLDRFLAGAHLIRSGAAPVR